MKTCQKCGRKFERLLAVSRDDNETMICDDCGIIEALDSVPHSRPEDEMERICRFSKVQGGIHKSVSKDVVNQTDKRVRNRVEIRGRSLPLVDGGSKRQRTDDVI